MSRYRRAKAGGAASLLESGQRLPVAASWSVALLLAAACSEGGTTDRTSAERTAEAEADTSIASSDTLRIEGRAEVVPIAPFSSGGDFPLAFRTLVPDPARLKATLDDPDATETGRGFAGAARFEWQAGADPAFLRLVVLDSSMSDNDARGLVRSIATDFGVIASAGIEDEEGVPAPGHPWSILGYRLRGLVDGVAVDGWISLGMKDDHPFYFMALYPPQYGDGLGPRFDYILRQWVWLDGDRPLYP